jgi:hypothetical protein
MPHTGSRTVFGAGCMVPDMGSRFSAMNTFGNQDWTILDGFAIHISFPTVHPPPGISRTPDDPA